MKSGLLLSFAFFFAAILSACNQMELRSSGGVQRGIASVGSPKVIAIHMQSCEDADKLAVTSPSADTIAEATETCQNASAAFCTGLVEKSSDGADTGDGRYIATACELTAAYGGNLAVNQGHASPKCESAYKAAAQSPSTDDVESAADVCSTEQNAACVSQADKEGDGDNKLAGPLCQLTAAHGAFMSVTKKK